MRHGHIVKFAITFWLAAHCILRTASRAFSVPASDLSGRARPRRRCVAREATDASQGHRFLLARHGQTTFNAEKRFQGSLDAEPVLTEKGRAQARDLGAWLNSLSGTEDDPRLVFTSPLLRARQTLAEAKTVAKDLPDEAEALAELREIDLYEWEGLTQAEVKASNPEAMRLWKEEAWKLHLGGDRLVVHDLWERASSAWSKMRATFSAGGNPALIVAHGTLGKALLSTAMELPVQAFRRFALGNGEVVEVLWPHPEKQEGARWRKRYPSMGPWRSVDDEAADFANAVGTESVDIA